MTHRTTEIGYRLRIFLSSAHYGLEDLRGELDDYLREFGTPFISSEIGFPGYPGIAPYVGCLRALEQCKIVIGVVDRRYGQPFLNWEPYSEYAGLSPTHAELRHALKLGKRFYVYVRDSVAAYYDIYRNNKGEFNSLTLPDGLQVQSLEMYSELKMADPAPWIETFHDVRQVKSSIRARILNDLYIAFEENESLTLRAKAAELSVPNRVFLKPKEIREGWITVDEAANNLNTTRDDVKRLLSTGQLIARHYGGVALVSTESLHHQKLREIAAPPRSKRPDRAKQTAKTADSNIDAGGEKGSSASMAEATPIATQMDKPKRAPSPSPANDRLAGPKAVSYKIARRPKTGC